MKTKIILLAIGLLSAGIIFTACNKDSSSIAASTDTSTDSDIAVAASDSSVGKDSVYIEHECGGGLTRDSIAQSELPAAAISYLDSNYAGYTFAKAFSVSDATGAITGYVAVIYSNENPVGLEFDSEGALVGVLRQHDAEEHRRGRHH